MPNTLDVRIQRIYSALDAVVSDHLTTANVKPEITEIRDKVFRIGMDFNQGASEIELMNDAMHLVANIASIKDHFKVWCKSNNVSFIKKGDELIDNNQAVGIIHDLWNIDKHAELK